MNKLNTAKRTQAVAALVEGNSVRATCRMTGIAKGTALSLLVKLGAACEQYQDRGIRNLKTRRIQCDEIWSFCYAKNRNVPKEHAGEWGYGDGWTWTAIDADSKLVPSWAIGRRDGFTATAFIRDLADRLANRVQLTTDGAKVYLEAVEGAFGSVVDYAMLVKMYEGDSGKRTPAERRYSPAVCTDRANRSSLATPTPTSFPPAMSSDRTSRCGWSMRRFTRLTNAFSKKVDNLKAAVALHFMHYNFARIPRPYG